MSGQDGGRSRAGIIRTGVSVGHRKTRLKAPKAGDLRVTVDDRSRHNHSRHHHGDTNNITNYDHYGETHHDMVIQRKCERALKELKRRISRGAAHDSAERGPYAPKCHKGTREAVQGEMLSWIDLGDQDATPAEVTWLCGPAGCGKSAIAGSVADACHARGWLAGSFFLSSFAGKPDRCSKEYIIPTLAYQFLHTTIPGLREEILLSIDANPSVFDKHLDLQLDILVLGPLRKVAQVLGPSAWPKAIVIDGVDECNADNGKGFKTSQDRRRSQDDNHREILSTLLRASGDSSFPFRIIITSRPERAIKDYFTSLPQGLVKEVFLGDKYDPQADIALYLRAMFKRIGREHRMPDHWSSLALPPGWPHNRTRDVPLFLAQESSGQFIYAATVIRFVQDGPPSPIEQLRRLLSSQRPADSKPFARLDALYTLILKTSPTPLFSAILICAVNYLNQYSVLETSWYIKAVLESSHGEAELLLRNLASLIGLSSRDNGETYFIHYHKSLLDFFEDPRRSGELYIDRDSVLAPFLRGRYYQVLKNRGPQVYLPSQLQNKFLETFCFQYDDYHSHRLQYDTSDVDWWCSHADFEDGEGFTPRRTFESVHKYCLWYHCHSSCEVWRKGILRHCKAKGWRVPTWKELLEDRFKKVAYVGISSTRSPLRPPPHRAPTDLDTASSSKDVYASSGEG